METITLYSANEFRKLFDFENSYEWLDLGGESLVLVETADLLPAQRAEARVTVETFMDGNSVYIHPWELAASGIFDLPERFVIKL
jgi:hypothetical protein